MVFPKLFALSILRGAQETRQIVFLVTSSTENQKSRPRACSCSLAQVASSRPSVSKSPFAALMGGLNRRGWAELPWLKAESCPGGAAEQRAWS